VGLFAVLNLISEFWFLYEWLLCGVLAHLVVLLFDP